MRTTSERLPDLAPRERPPAPPLPPRHRPWALILIAGLALVLIVALVAGVLLLRSIRNPLSPQTVDRTQPAVLKALEDLSQYRAASGQFQVVIDLEKDFRYVPSFLKGERTLFVASGAVDATVDFSRIGPDSVGVSDDRRAVTIELPRATLSGARVDPGKSYVFERERGLIDRLGSVFSDSPAGERELYLLAERKLDAAAAEGGVAERAEGNTRQMLQSLLRSLGFTEVAVSFR